MRRAAFVAAALLLLVGGLGSSASPERPAAAAPSPANVDAAIDYLLDAIERRLAERGKR